MQQAVQKKGFIILFQSVSCCRKTFGLCTCVHDTMARGIRKITREREREREIERERGGIERERESEREREREREIETERVRNRERE